MKRLIICLLTIAVTASAAMAQQSNRAVGSGSAAQAAIEQAAAANKYMFMLFWRDRSPQTSKAWATLQPWAARMANSAAVAAVQVTDPKEKELVTRYGVNRAPLPLVLAIAPCGAITKAFTGEFNEQELQVAFVSPCTQQCLKATRGSETRVCLCNRR